MPAPTQILADLARIANDAWSVALTWHVLAAFAGVMVWRGWRPSSRLTALLLSALLLSVGAVALVYGSRFNGVTFVGLSTLLTGVSVRFCSDADAIEPGPTWARAAGVVLVAFGWFYPHFLDTPSLAVYALAAPLGILPCPTLAFAAGVTLLAGGLSRSWSVLLALAALAYGVFGAGRLGVRLDLILVAGAVALLVSGALGTSGLPTNQRRRGVVAGM